MRAAIFLIALAVPALAVAAPPVPLDRGQDYLARPAGFTIVIPRRLKDGSAKPDDAAELAKEREAVSAALKEALDAQAQDARKTGAISSVSDLLYRDTDPRAVADKAPPEALKPNVADEPSVRQSIPGFQLIEKAKAEK